MQANEPRWLLENNEKEIVIIGLGHRDAGGDSERVDDLRQRIGMSNHQNIAPGRSYFRD